MLLAHLHLQYSCKFPDFFTFTLNNMFNQALILLIMIMITVTDPKIQETLEIKIGILSNLKPSENAY